MGDILGCGCDGDFWRFAFSDVCDFGENLFDLVGVNCDFFGFGFLGKYWILFLMIYGYKKRLSENGDGDGINYLFFWGWWIVEMGGDFFRRDFGGRCGDGDGGWKRTIG